MSISFYGSSGFSLTILKKLKEFHDKGLITLAYVVSKSSDRSRPVNSKGRKHEDADNPVVAYCKEVGVRVENQSVPERAEGRVVSSVDSITTLSNEIPQQVRDDINVDIDLAIVASYGRIIKQEELDSTKYGFLNIHGSLLPKWRGACPVQMCVRYQDIENTGITIIKMDKGMDTGDILKSEKLEVESEEFKNITSGELMDKLAELSAEVLERDFDLIFNPEKWGLEKQHDNEATYCSVKDMDKSNFEITQSDTMLSAHGKIMSANPEPKAYGVFKIGEKEIKANLLRSRIIENEINNQTETHDIERHNHSSLRIFEKKLYLDLSDGTLEILEIQPEGKKIMTGKDFVNGFR